MSSGWGEHSEPWVTSEGVINGPAVNHWSGWCQQSCLSQTREARVENIVNAGCWLTLSLLLYTGWELVAKVERSTINMPLGAVAMHVSMDIPDLQPSLHFCGLVSDSTGSGSLKLQDCRWEMHCQRRWTDHLFANFILFLPYFFHREFIWVWPC